MMNNSWYVFLHPTGEMDVDGETRPVQVETSDDRKEWEVMNVKFTQMRERFRIVLTPEDINAILNDEILMDQHEIRFEYGTHAEWKPNTEDDDI